MPTIHLLIKGKVQGVFFRATARQVAEKLDLKGWVKNTGEGDVEITVSGEDDNLEKYVEWCRKGPEKAHVSGVTITQVPEEIFRDFSIKKDKFW